MKKIACFLLVFLFFSVALDGCKGKKSDVSSTPTSSVSSEEEILQLATQITNSVLNEEPNFLNNLFDTLAIRKTLSDNSIIASQLDTELGRQALAYNLKFGDFAVQAVSNGGDFRFLKYYFDEEKLHMIFRTYDDFGLQIIDYVFHHDKNNQLKIEDGYIYNMSAGLTQSIMYDILYTIMQNLQMQDTITQHLTQAITLFEQEKYTELMPFLQKYQEELLPYPVYNYLYINSLNETSSHFIDDLNALVHLDSRCILIHELIYYTHTGNYAEAEKSIQKLMDYTGEDPIYWLFYGKALYNAKEYTQSLDAYTNAENGMDEIWDLWRGKQDCYYKLHDMDALNQGYEVAKEKFGMTDEDIEKDSHHFYPAK